MVSLIFLALLVILSVIFYRERMLFIDAPHNLFLIINDGHLHIEEHRYGSFVSQVLPFLGAKAGLPLSAVMLLYSVGFTLFFLAVGLVVFFRFRNYSLVVLFALYLALFASASFYWPNNEVHQGMGWLTLALAGNFYLARSGSRPWFAVLFFLLSFFLAVWTHPLIMIVALFLWFFCWAGNFNWPFNHRQALLFTALLFLLVAVKFNTGRLHGYDSSKIEAVTSLKPGMLASFLHSADLHGFLKNCLYNYWLFVVLFIAGLGGLLAYRRYLLIAMVLLSSVGYLFLVCITFPGGSIHQFYIESEFMPLAVIGSAPFVFFVLPYLKARWGVVLLLVVFIVRLGYIVAAAPPFSNRIAVLGRIEGKMKDKGLTKAIISPFPAAIDSALVMSWGAPVESIFLSKLNGEMPQRTFIFLSVEDARNFYTSGTDTMLGCWEKRPESRLNARYFRLDTGATYTTISFDDLMK